MKNNTKLTQTIGSLFKSIPVVLSLCIVLICGVLSIFAYAIAPDNSKDANQMHLSIHSMAPGFSTMMIYIPSEESSNGIYELFFGKSNPDLEIPIQSFKETPNGITYTEYNTSQTKTVLWDTFPKHITHKDIIKKYIREKTFWLGTDKYGRDLLSRLIIGTRISFSVGCVAVLISLIIGIFIGTISGYFGGYTDRICMWLISVIWSVPTLLLVIALTIALGKGHWQVFIAIGITMWVEVARVVRGQVLSLRKMPYIEAGKSLGFSHLRIIIFHILPNMLSPIIIISVANFASAILIESGLSFLGIGTQPPTPSWGNMIKDHYAYIITGKAYLAIAPGIAIMLLVVSFMLIGNKLRDTLDIKS